MRALLTILATALICAAGFAAALTFAPVANAWSTTNLPPGWVIAEHDTGGLDPNCQDAYRIRTDTNVVSGLFCTGSPTYQQDFDAWVDAHYTPPVTTTAASTTDATTTAASTTTDATTTTAPVDTLSTPAVTTPATTTTTPACDLACLTARVNALELNYAALAARVDAIAKANTASWDAYIAASGAGASATDAALAARSAGLNAIYQLG